MAAARYSLQSAAAGRARRGRRVALATVAALAGCALAVGCGTQPGPLSPGTTSRTSPATTSGSAPPAAPAPVLPPRQRAHADASAILAAFVPPPGARRLTSDPAAASLLRQPPMYAGMNNLVDDVSFWHVAMAPTDVLDWEAAHLPRQFDSQSGGQAPWGSGGYINGANYLDGSWSLAPVYWVLPERTLLVAVEDIGHGQTVVRVDAQVTWLDPQPASERLPSAAAIVTFTALRGSASYIPPAPAPVTITDPARVRRIAALVNSLPLYPQPDVLGCPDDSGQQLVLTFRGTSGGAVLAVATIGLGGCPGVSLTIGGRPEPMLTGASTLAGQTLLAAGLHWPGYDKAGSAGPGETPGPIVITTPADPAS